MRARLDLSTTVLSGVFHLSSLRDPAMVERFSFDENKGTDRQPSFWSFDWYCELSANARALYVPLKPFYVVF